MKIQLCSYTHLAFLINGIIDDHPATDLTFEEIHAAASQGRLFALLVERYGHIADFGALLGSRIVNLEQMEAALSDAACALEGREARKACVEKSGLCLAMAIVLETIQQQFHQFPMPTPRPEDESHQPSPRPSNGL